LPIFKGLRLLKKDLFSFWYGFSGGFSDHFWPVKTAEIARKALFYKALRVFVTP